ncbi:hypothetical protein [uncultured Sphaerotilus sp.]|uniref:hypothetical protein n=1 Tax=uncultured Sphaerotilus sp. TaxID=474984 RepID=UPI0030CA15DE
MTAETVDNLHREVQCKLGRCLIRLQQYEQLLKALLPATDIQTSWQPGQPQPQTSLQAATERLQHQTLGQLVKEFIGIHSEPEQEAKEPDEEPEPEGVIFFRTQLRIETASGGLAGVESNLRGMVTMRNALIHHFLERFDIWTVDGCLDADRHLDECFGRMDAHFRELHTTALAFDAARQELLVLMRSPEFMNQFCEGVFPDGQIHWPSTRVVQCLLQHCAVDPVAWTVLGPVIQSMQADCPEEVPSKYRCKTWRQLLKRSEVFEVRTDIDDQTGQGRTWFRPMASSGVGATSWWPAR